MLSSTSLLTQTSVEPVQVRDTVTPIVRAVVRATQSWGLTNQDQARLFDVPIATWNRMRADAYRGILDQDKVTRASLILGIHQGLAVLFNGPLTDDWPRTPNQGAPFEGRSPVEMMVAGGIPAMIVVRQHIDALRGGL